ncbi:hypothetical protein AVEN_120845-1 [Araneus ventricosus]|uniref:Peptidase aspartic putative domain-containing protein n=1 Tax=Araneus ventricosus TaxID=182803 RepID=A0A4Y2U2E4_ARAVE|nr:hypothetical protein AVEN_104700-1 [Araneus ventricosus]GBO05844.1 hypothetical protein AVEN_120845-1 [Araneus ventricosus]
MSKKSSEKDDCNAVSEKKLNREKGAIKGTLSRIETFTSEKTVSKDTNITELQVKLKKLEQLQTQLDKISEKYCEIETSEKFETIQQDIEQINERIEETEVGLKILLSNENTITVLNDNGKAKIRLPEIPLPEFSGKIAEFANFKNQFTNLISNNDQLNDSQNLYYLSASLKGEAKLLESSSDNFQSLFKASDRYENQRQLIDSHVLEIINYDKIHSESAEELRALMDCVNKNIRALKVLKYEQNKLSDVMLINIILQKIDKESRKQFELSLKTAEIPTFDILMKFLETRSSLLDSINRIPNSKMINRNTAVSNRAKTLVVNNKKGNIIGCILCKNYHALSRCIVFQNMSIESRKNFVRNNKLCINCLRLHSGACMSKHRCSVSGCRELHNSLLHQPDEIRTASQVLNSGEGEEAKSNPSTAEGQTEVSVLMFANKSVVLNTLFIYAKTADGCRVKLRCLLDNVSTLCIIREDVA